MWFLEVDIAVRLLAATLLWSLGSFIARKYWSQAKFDRFLVILDLALIAYVSEWLAVFYLGYTLVTWVIVNAVDKFKRAKSFFFVLCCLSAPCRSSTYACATSCPSCRCSLP